MLVSKRAVTLKDISVEIGVSVTQVSRALGGFGDVSAETRQRVQEAALRLGYRPNAIARGLKTGRSGIVAMVVPASIEAPQRGGMFEIVIGISTAVSRNGMRLILHVSQPDDDPADVHEDLFKAGGIDGFIVVEPVADDQRIGRLQQLGVPYVVHGRDPKTDHHFVDVDNVALARTMAACLRAHGHRHIAFLNGPEGFTFSEARASGFRAELGKLEAAGGALWILPGVMTAERGERDVLELLAHPNRPTAFIAGNLMLAKGVYDAAQRMSYRIPDDLSVLGHDDGLSQYPPSCFTPVIGGTRSWLKDAWSDLADLLQRLIEDGPEDAPSVVLDVAFAENRSVAKPPG